MNAQQKEAIYWRVKDKVLEVSNLAKPYPADMSHLSLYWTYFLFEELRTAGVSACVQAGSISWLLVPKNVPAGDYKGARHFTRTWDLKSKASKLALRIRGLPEMHTWVGIPSTQEIVDLSTGFLPAEYNSHNREGWPVSTLPPSYVWNRVDQLPPGAWYTPWPDAGIFANTLIHFLEREGFFTKRDQDTMAAMRVALKAVKAYEAHCADRGRACPV